MDWWTVRKIKKWKVQNKISNQNDDTLDNSHTRVCEVCITQQSPQNDFPKLF